MSSENSLSDPEKSEHEEIAIEQQEDEKLNEENEEYIKQEELNKIEIQQNESDKSVGTYIFQGEDHTFGNAIREILTMEKNVDFVGYTIPHPSENKINLRLQVKGQHFFNNKIIDQNNANVLLKSGLKNLIKVCESINEKFDKALVEFQEKEAKPEKQKKSKKGLKKE